MTTTLIIVSDTHIGCSVSLCTPEQNLPEGDKRVSSPAQIYLYNQWMNFVAHISKIKGKKIYLGSFKTEQLAHEQYVKALNRLHEYNDDALTFRNLLLK